jgi:hypothetical protein
VIHADRAFTDSLDFKEFCSKFKIRNVGGANSQSQGQVEVMNREIQKNMLRLGCDSEAMSVEGFQVKLSRMVLHHNTTGRVHLNWLSPNEVLLGWNPIEFEETYWLDLDQMKELLHWRKQLYRYLYEDRKTTGIPEDNYKEGDLILIKVKDGPKRAKNTVRNWGPFLVLDNPGNGLVRVQYPDGATGDVSTKEIIRYNVANNLSGGGGDDQIASNLLKTTDNKEDADQGIDHGGLMFSGSSEEQFVHSALHQGKPPASDVALLGNLDQAEGREEPFPMLHGTCQSESMQLGSRRQVAASNGL